jgi:GNAT superfamily N-acetyltransferase
MRGTPLRIATFTGPSLATHIAALARLRITVFRDFPYLYDGDPEQERVELEHYAASPRAALVVAFDGDAPVGCSTCVPAADEEDTIQEPLRARGADPATVCYFGESVLLPAYRGRGVGVAFFAEREAHARDVCGSTITCFAAVRRPADHPLRPADHVPLDDFWRHRGYAPWPGPPLVYRWRQIDAADKVTNQLDLWMKRL